MGQVVQGLAGLFSGPSNRGLEQASAQRELATIAQQREAQRLDEANSRADAQMAAGGRPRGSRLLVSQEGGGLATTLGGAQ